MKHIVFLFLLLPFSIFSQDTVETSFIKSVELKADNIVSVDSFESIYYVENNTFYKKTKTKTISYNNLQLGELTSVNAFNPLKIILFYKVFNTVIILDNRLAEIFKIDFNAIQPYKNVTHVSSGFDNTLWAYNQDTQQLELYNYKNNITQSRSLPIQSKTLDLKSNYNHVWLLTESHLYVYNYFGNLLSKVKNDGFTALVETNGNIIAKKDNTLFYIKNSKSVPAPITLPNLLINHFFATNESLYIYHNQTLQQFQLKTN